MKVILLSHCLSKILYRLLGLQEGFWPFFLTVFFVGSGYLCLTLCLAEMTSFLPFAGGSYGYARCALGPIPGFLVGICETIEYVLYVTSAVLELGNLISFVLNISPAYEPLYWLLFFVISLFIQVYSQRLFWTFNTVIAAITLVLILLYFFASIPSFDYHSNLHERTFHIKGGMTDFMFYFPLASWFYVGVEVMTLSCSEVKDAGKIVPKAMVACMITLFITSFLILFSTCLQSPGPYTLHNEFLPLNPGYQNIFNISPQLATILAIPGTFATAFGFMFAYGRQIYSMATSGLFPHFLSKTYGEHKAPITALFLGSTLSFGSLLFLWYLYPNFARQLFNLCMLGSCSVYVALFRSYIVCRKRYSNLPRMFQNSLGIYSAIYGMIVFGFMIVALAFFQQDHYISITVFVSFIVVFLLYYFLVVQKREFFSDEEQAKFMKAYILNGKKTCVFAVFLLFLKLHLL
jgi:ethanolamine permease